MNNWLAQDWARSRTRLLSSPCSLNLYVGHIIENARLEELQAGINIAGGNISNFRYADDTTLMAESEEELKSLLMRVKEESEKASLNWNCNQKSSSKQKPRSRQLHSWILPKI